MSSNINASLARYYTRLYVTYGEKPVTINIPEISNILFCSPRHARMLLKLMRDHGLISWISKSGRGAKGQLHCKVLLTEMPVDDTQHCDNTPQKYQTEKNPPLNLIIALPKPVGTLAPSLITGRIERHLIRMIHCGLLRFTPQSNELSPGIAHHWYSCEGGYKWRFFLYDNLIWHNGEPVSESNIILQLRMILLKREFGEIFNHVLSVNLVEKHCIEVVLLRPDPFLPYRLANPVCAFTFSEDSNIGLGPFYVSEHTERLLLLKRWGNYANQISLVNSVSHVTVPEEIHTLSKIKIDIENCKGKYSTTKTKNTGFAFLMFNHKNDKLSILQKKFIRIISINIVKSMCAENTCVGIPNDTWYSTPEEFWDRGEFTQLPKSISLCYFYTPLIERLVRELKKRLKNFGCNLTLSIIPAINFLRSGQWNECDLCIGDYIPGDNIPVSLEWVFRCSPLSQNMISETMYERGVSILNIASSNLSESRYARKLYKLAKWLILNLIVTPLFIDEFTIECPCELKDMKFYPQGWPSYEVIWYDPF